MRSSNQYGIMYHLRSTVKVHYREKAIKNFLLRLKVSIIFHMKSNDGQGFVYILITTTLKYSVATGEQKNPSLAQVIASKRI
jgi:hypothetical protein